MEPGNLRTQSGKVGKLGIDGLRISLKWAF
jgi:hypothetical protein